MAILGAAGLGLALLFLWLGGHWFGWLFAGPVVALLVQFFLQDPADTGSYKFMRMAAVFLLAGIPCITWGSLAKLPH